MHSLFALFSSYSPLWGKIKKPWLQLRLFTNRVFSSGGAVMFFGGAINFGAQVVLPLYFIQTWHVSLLVAGLLIGPQVIGTSIGFPLAGRLADQYGAGSLLLASGVITAIATLPLALVGVNTSYTCTRTSCPCIPIRQLVAVRRRVPAHATRLPPHPCRTESASPSSRTTALEYGMNGECFQD